MHRFVFPVGIVPAVAMILCSGCATPGQDLLSTGVVSVLQSAAGAVRVTDICVHQDGETLIVEGRLSRPGGAKVPSLGYVEVTVTTPDGRSLGQKRLAGRWRTCHGTAPFVVCVPLVAPKGSMVKVLYQDSAGDNGGGVSSSRRALRTYRIAG